MRFHGLSAEEACLNRNNLFDRVWAEPMAKLAPKWGLSGPGLKKHQKRLDVPTPPRGYWPKMWAGKKVKRPKLPELETGQGEEIVMWEGE